MTQLKDYLFYQDGWVTIYCGDCLEIMPLMEPESVDLVVTDPPYNIGKKYGALTDDNRPLGEYLDWFEQVFSLVFKRMSNGYIYLSHSDRGIYDVKPKLENIGFRYIQTLIWWGRNGYSMQLHRNSWSYRHEPILFMEKGKGPYLQAGIKDQWYTSVIEVPRPQSNFKEGRYHPTEKPVRLFRIIIDRSESKMILDPFVGSGTCLIAAHSLNKKSIGIEIEAKYCEIAVKRLRQEVFDFRKRDQ
jgi:site-specific DNA-methyltransferase (adenine-specific)